MNKAYKILDLNGSPLAEGFIFTSEPEEGQCMYFEGSRYLILEIYTNDYIPTLWTSWPLDVGFDNYPPTVRQVGGSNE